MAYNYTSGTATNSADLLSKLNTFVVTTCGWTLHDNQSGASPAYYVWKTTGEDGNQECYIRCTYGTTDGLVLNTYRYWDNVAHSGYNPSPAFSVTTYGIWSSHTSSFLYWLYGDLDRVVVVTKSTTYYHIGSFGVLASAFSTSFATTQNAESAGSNVVIEVNTTLPFAVGEYYVIVNSNSATGQYERVQVTAINPGVSITVASLANNHPAGAVIGEDPRPNYIIRYLASSASMTGATGTDAIAYSVFTLSGFLPVQYTDPDARKGLTWLFPAMVYSTSPQEYRGTLKEIYIIGGGDVDNQDTITVSGVVYKVFNGTDLSGTGIMRWVAIKQETL